MRSYGKYEHISSVYLIYFSLNERLLPHIKLLYCSCLYIYHAESACMTAIIFNYALLYTCRCPLVQYKRIFISICSVYIFYVSISDCAFLICTYL